MLIPPNYFLTSKITQLLAQIEASREVIDSVDLPLEIERNIKRQSTLKSSLFSARIEGNPLELEDIAKVSSKDQKKVEVFNILKALNWMGQRSARDITIKDVLTLHNLSMKGLVINEDLGKFRTKHEAIFNYAQIPIFHAPPPGQINKLMEKVIKYANSDKEQLAPVRACLVHYTFEKIHPFTDGSGRVGRLLLQMVLAKSGYGMKGLLPFEEKIDKKREIYYRMLEESERDVTDYLEFMLEVIAESADEAKKFVVAKNFVKPTDFLLPRRAEILNIVTEQNLVNFDFIKRRLPKVNSRTLRYDIKKLVDSSLIIKLGTTRGVYYQVKK